MWLCVIVGRPLKQLIKEGWDEIPETMFGLGAAIVGALPQFVFFCL